MTMPAELKRCINSYAKQQHYQITTMVIAKNNPNKDITIVLDYNYYGLEGNIVFAYGCFAVDGNLVALKAIKDNKSTNVAYNGSAYFSYDGDKQSFLFPDHGNPTRIYLPKFLTPVIITILDVINTDNLPVKVNPNVSVRLKDVEPNSNYINNRINLLMASLIDGKLK